VVGDPREVFSPGAVRHALRPLIRWKMARDLARHVDRAIAAAYVTRQVLQRRYPCPAFEVGVSDVQLSREDVVPRPRTAFPTAGGSLQLITVGTFDQFYKGPDVLVDAVGLCVGRGLDITLRFVGGGAHLDEIRRRVERRRLADRVCFDGQVASRAALLERLDASDLFVLPSRAEGLPRAMIEAMARGLPCLGSRVGGIPELLDPEDTTPPGDARALAQKIEEVIRTPARLADMSRRSVDRVRAFESERLAPTRLEFYRRLLQAARSRAAA
jgi:glycosyltransferase involved in cell wall biosynthesis